MIKRYIQTDRGKIYYWTNDNDKETIMFLHGLTADHHLFDKQVDYFSDDYNLILVDLPLHGQSKGYQEFSYDHVSKDLSCLLDAESIEQVILVCQSAGGYIGQSFYKNYSERVKAFVGIGTTPFGRIYYKKSDLFWIKHFAAIAQLYPYKSYCKASAKSVGIRLETQKSMLKTLESMTKVEILKAVKVLYEGFLRETEEIKFACPVLLTYGEKDKTGYVKKYNQTWSQRQGYLLKMIPNAAHNANFDNWSRFNDVLYNFIDNL